MRIRLLLIFLTLLIIPTYLYVDEAVAKFVIRHSVEETFIFNAPNGVAYTIPLKYSDFYVISEYLSEAGISTYFLLPSALLWLYFSFYKKIELYASRAAFLFLSVALSGIVTNILKFIFGKARPRVLESSDFFGFTWFNFQHSYNSFPSGHTTTAFAVFTVLSLMYPKYWWLFLCYAISIALARIGYYAHYPSDTIAGAVVGTAVTLLVYNKFFIEKGKHI